MKTLNLTRSALLIGSFSLLLVACTERVDPTTKQDDTITPLNNDQVSKLWDLSTKQQMIGEPVVIEYRDTVNGGAVTRKVTTQHYSFTFEVDEKGHPVAGGSGSSTMARQIRTGYGITTCSSSCSSINVGQTCSVSGCNPNGDACTAPSCPSGCFSYSCTKTSSGFSRGLVMF